MADMWPYWTLFFLPLIYAAISSASNATRQYYTGNARLKKNERVALLMYGIFMTAMVGLRHEVGGDWTTYIEHLENTIQLSWFEGITLKGEPAYGLINWISIHIGVGVYGVNLICAFFFVFGLMAFSCASPQPWLALCVAVPYLVIVVAMGYTRQGVAIGLIMLGIVALCNGLLWRFAAWTIFAALFHKAALILLPMAVFAGQKKWMAVLGVMVVGMLMFYLLLAEYVDILVSGYLIAGYESSGAAIRVAMNALPAAVFLIFRRRFRLSSFEESFWFWMSWGALIFVVLLIISPSSTAVDRVALYWIPIQIFVWTRLPQAMGQYVGTQRQWTAIVLIYSISIQYVWLFHADHSFAWLPYKFYPWEWLWK